MEEVILAGFSERFFVHYREIERNYSISAVAESSDMKTESLIGIQGCRRCSFEDIDIQGRERILIVSQSRCIDIIRELLGLGIDRRRIIIWTPSLYLKESDYSLVVEEDGTVLANVLSDGVNLRAYLKAYSDFFIFEEIFLQNTYRFITGTDCILLDIGMNVGLASLYFAAKSFVRKIYAFEPFKPTYDRALANFDLNEGPVKNKIQAFNYGLSDADQKGYFPYLDNNPGNMKTTREYLKEDSADNGQAAELREAGREIDRIMRLEPDAGYVIKIDCEGAEYDIIPNLVKWNVLDRVSLIIMETHDGREDEIVGLIAGQGFTVYSDRPSPHLTGKLIAFHSVEH